VGISYAQGQGPLQAQVDRTTLSTDETLVLTVTVSASVLRAPSPVLPSLLGLIVTGNSTSSQMSMVNGDVKSQIVYTYRLQPYETGDLVIDPISVTIDSKTYSTQPIVVRVTQGTGASAPAASNQQAVDSQSAIMAAELTGQDLYVEAEVDNPRPFLGQQVVYTFRLYQARNLWDQPQYEAPTFTGFWKEHESDQQTYRVQAAGRIYDVTELQNILFPSVVGPVTIDPARLTIPGSLFRSGQTLQTRPVQLEVQPLPPNAPEGFSGAVGQFSIEGWLDSAQGKVNEPLTWHVTLSGWGNLSTVPDPTWPDMPGWRDFDSQATIHSEVRDGHVGGSRVYERLMVPTAQGQSTVPSLEYVYFDPTGGTYQTIATEAVQVSIAPGDPGAPAAPRPMGSQKETVEQIGTDIRHLKPVPTELAQADQPVTTSSLYWAAWLFPVFGAAGYFTWQRRQRFWETNQGLARSSKARKKARKALAEAKKRRAHAYTAAGRALTTYLAEKLNRPVAGLTHEALADLLAENGVSPDLIERVQVLLDTSEFGRYAPGADSPEHAESLLQEAVILIEALEKVL
jgi:hypothetical protein